MKKLLEMIPGETFENLSALVIKKQVAATKKGAPYLRVHVRDLSGEVAGVMWDYKPDIHVVEEGQVIDMWGAVEDFNGSLQLKIGQFSPSLVAPEMFYKSTRFDVAMMWGELVDLVGSFKEPLTKFVAEELLLKQAAFVEAFKKAPAATGVHNNWFGGLLEHVWSLCRVADGVVTHYTTHYYPHISRDKVMFGLMLHDAAKVIEYDYRNPAFPHTGIGILTNHMVLGPAWTYETANRFPGKNEIPNFKLERALLMHTLAAHHGTHEWGSPVTPSTLEAILVHHLDNLDTRVLHALNLIEGKEGNIAGFSERSYVERTSYYKPQ